MRDKRQNRKLSLQVESMEERAATSTLAFQMAAVSMGATPQRTVASRPTAFAAASRVARFNASRFAFAPGAASRLSSTSAVVPRAGIVPRPAGTVTLLPSSSTNVTSAASNGDIGDVKNGPLAKAGQDLIKLYQDFLQFNGGTFRSTHAPNIQVVGTSVRVDIRGPGNVNSLASALANLGMQVQATDARTHTVEGLLPIAKLPDAAQLPQVTTISPVYVAKTARLH